MWDFVKKVTYGARVLLARRGEKQIVTVGGHPTQVLRGGQGAPLVYLHSALGETVWLPFHDAWAAQFDVIAPAHPGFADSQGLEDIGSMDDLVFHYAELFDTLGLDDFALGGVSLGGWIAVEYAVRYPDRVRRLWLADAAGLWLDAYPYFDLFRYAQDVRRLREALFHDPDSAVASMIVKDVQNSSDETLIAVYRALTALARLVWERPYSPHLPQRLSRIRCPTLIVWGASDRLIAPAYAEEYHRLIPNSTLKILEHCGHLPMFECEREFVRLVADFCRSEQTA